MISRIKALLSSLEFKRLDKRRIDLAMAWAQRHPLAATAYNVGNYLFLGVVKCGLVGVQAASALRARVRTRGAPPDPAEAARRHEPFPPLAFPKQPRVLLVVEPSIPQCFLYRVQQKLDMLEAVGWQAAWLPWSDIERVRREMHFHDVVILYRVPGFEAVLSLIRYAASINKLLIYDLDDLVFDRDQLERKFSGNRGQLSLKVYRELLSGAELYRRAISLVPFCLVSTESLRQQVERIEGVRAFVLPNGVSSDLAALSRTPRAERDRGRVNVFYGSGTRTHDADFQLVSPVLQQLLSEHPEMHLVIAGPVVPGPGFERFPDRVSTLDFLDYACYLDVLAHADINVAPLEPGPFADCKSEIKWIEAGMLGLPSVVSRTRTYEDVIDPGNTGFIADSREDWKQILSALINDGELRHRVGSSARSHIEKNYGPGALGRRLTGLIEHCAEASPHHRPAPPERPLRVLMVNTLYPPQSMGGATRVVKTLVDGLRRSHPGDVEVQVFTCDVHDTRPYRLNQYVHDGVVVTSLSVPMRADIDTVYRDDAAMEIFTKFLRHRAPDLVHFHSMQRLTASLLEATEHLALAHAVSLHDSWWISDHPFMMDDRGNVLPANIANPLVARRYTRDFNATVTRTLYLRHRLERADALIAVSNYQADLYARNGFSGVQVIENGVDKPAGFRRTDHPRLVLGYVGGESAHKGYFFLKDCVARAELDHVQLVVVDLFSKDSRVRTENWGRTPVEVHPRYDFARAGAFYSLLDVLVVPSLWPESFGLAAREASLLGLWVVAASAGGLANAVVDGETGFVFEPGNRRQFESILAELDRNWTRYKQPVDESSVAGLNIRATAQNVHDTYQLYVRTLSESRAAEASPAHANAPALDN